MSSNLPTEDDSKLKQLCFNLTHFQRTDFDSVRFVNFSRKRATLAQLHSDLRIYLRYLQNSMIELINDDYADFVNLSSGLAALRDSVDKVKNNIQGTWYNFESTISDLERCAQLVNNYLSQLNKARKEQIIAKNKLSLLQSIQRLYKFLENRPKEFGNIWFSKLFLLISSIEYWLECLKSFETFILQLKIPKEKCYQKATDLIIDQLCEELKFIINQEDKNITSKKSNLATLLASLKLLHEKERAELRVINLVIQYLRNDSKKKIKMDILLQEVLNKVINIRQSWIIYAQNCNNLSEEVETFFDVCLLNSVISILDEPLVISIKEQIKPEEFKFKLPIDGDSNPCLCSYSNSILSSLHILYSSDYFLPSLANKFWEFTLQRMQDYLGWAQSIIDHFTSTTKKQQLDTNKSTQSTISSERKSVSPVSFKESSNQITSNNITTLSIPIWLGLAALSRDLQLFDTNLFQFCLSTIWDYLRQLKIDPTPFGQCLSLFSGQISEKRKEIEHKLLEILGGELAKNLSAVSDIPRQYRWTKRPQPIGFSTYLSSSFEIFEQFAEETANKLGFDEIELNQIRSQAMVIASNDFCERAEKVLDSVEQTGSSLLRFKQRKALASGQSTSEAASESDESKIRAQLCFDVNLVKQRAREYGLATEYMDRLERIEQRTATSEVSTKITGSTTECAD
uniref:Conserved oligomeric Golgi complex subunit 2 n=1 Tax=Meloidogyne javanica TaxID=6303 RepID=A0A915N2D8_MELJA